MTLHHNPNDQTTTVLRSFRKIQSQFGKWAQANSTNHNLSMLQSWILQIVHSEQCVPQKFIGERMKLSKSTLSTSVDGLVTQGYLNRIILEENRREVQLKITELGVDKVKEIHDDPNGVYQKMNRCLRQMPQESIDLLLKLHQELYEWMLQEDGGDNRC